MNELPQAVELPPIKLVPRMGRDPNDRFTMELPLEPLEEQGDTFTLALAQACFDEEDGPEMWLALLWWAETL